MSTSRQTDALHQACARLLAGDPELFVASAATRQPSEMLACLQREGIVSAAYKALAAASEELPSAVLECLADDARAVAARHMLWTREAGRIQEALQDAGIACLWLKGTALRWWLYDDPSGRDTDDLDLLLADHAAMLAAASVLGPLGYRLPNPHIAGDVLVHELLATNERLGLELDLHWDLSNDALFAGRLQWDALLARSQALPALGQGARCLGPVDALLHACIHLNANLIPGRGQRLRWLRDIDLLTARLSTREWAEFVERAGALGIASVCVDALESTEQAFGSQFDAAALAELSRMATSEPIRQHDLSEWSSKQRATWASLPDTRTRLRWLRQLLFPDIAHLRARYGNEETRALNLLLRRLRDGWRRWRRYASR